MLQCRLVLIPTDLYLELSQTSRMERSAKNFNDLESVRRPSQDPLNPLSANPTKRSYTQTIQADELFECV